MSKHIAKSVGNESQARLVNLAIRFALMYSRLSLCKLSKSTFSANECKRI